MTGRATARLGALPLRVRLVAGFLAAMTVLLTAAGVLVYWRVEYALDRGLDSGLARATSAIAPLVEPTGNVTSTAAADATGTGWQVLDSDGLVIESGGPVADRTLISKQDLSRVGEDSLTKDVGTLLPRTKRPYRVRVTALNGAGAVRYLAVDVPRGPRDEALRELLLQLGLAGAGALVGAAIVGDLLARAALRPVERFRRRAEDIATGSARLRLDVPVGRDDEVTRLGHTLNDMLAALEEGLENERRFVNDASHELRTPLTLLTTRIQMARRRPRTGPEHEQILDELAVDVSRLSALAEQLLTLGSSGSPSSGVSEVDGIVKRVVAQRQQGPGRESHILYRPASTSARASIDPVALERIVTNLIDNAVTHGAPPVVVDAWQATDDHNHPWLCLQVSDHGSGIDPSLLPEATRRFTRSAVARSKPGAGLGLAIVEALVTGAGGQLRLCHDNAHVRHGYAVPLECKHDERQTVTVLLPAPVVGSGVAG